MKTDNFNFNTIKNQIQSQLEKAQLEMEDLSTQFNQGKAEAIDKFEHFKNDLTSKINDWKLTGENIKAEGLEQTNKLKTKVDELKVQLALGKAEAQDLFEYQKKRIIQKVNELKGEIGGN